MVDGQAKVAAGRMHRRIISPLWCIAIHFSKNPPQSSGPHGCHDDIYNLIQRLNALVATRPPSRILYCIAAYKGGRFAACAERTGRDKKTGDVDARTTSSRRPDPQSVDRRSGSLSRASVAPRSGEPPQPLR